MSDQLNLDEIEARATAAAELAKQATAGPWYAHYGDEVEWDIAHTGAGNDGAENMVSTKSTVSHEETGAQEDAAFIAAARTDVPALAADVQALLAELETARALLMDCWHQLDGDVYVLPGGEVHPGAVTTIHALHAFLWPEGKTI